MTRIFQAVPLGCAVTVTVALFLLLRDLDRKVVELDVAKLNSTVQDLDSSVGVLHDAEAKQAAYYDPARPGGLPQQIQRTVVDLKKLVGHTDLNLNGGIDPITKQTVSGTLPQLAVTLESTNALVSSAAMDLGETTRTVQPILVDLGTASAAMAQKTPIAMDNLVEMSANGVKITQHTDETMVEIEGTSHDFHVFVHRELAPVRGTWNIIKGVIKDFGPTGTGIVTSLK